MTSYVVNGRFLTKPATGVVRVGHEMLRALTKELQEQPGLRVKVAAPALLGDETSLPGCPGPKSRIGEQAMLPLLYPSATIINFCNTAPALARKAIIWIHDTHVFEAPETYPKAYRLWHKFMFHAAVVRGFRIVTVSEHSRQGLIGLGAAAKRVSVIHNGGDHITSISAEEAILGAHGLERGGYFLIVGSAARHKNIKFAVEALEGQAETSAKIVIVGLGQSGQYASGAEVSRSERIVVMPRISDAQLRALYRHARALVIPSLFEGFCLPAAEAMFESTPLLLADRAALPEIGGNAALYFDATSRDSFLRAVLALETSGTRERLQQAALTQRENFRWRKSGRKLVELMLAS